MDIQLNHFTLPPLIISIILLWFITKHLFKPIPNKNTPPSPPKLPIIGNLHQLGRLPHRSLQSLARKIVPVMLLHFGRVPVLVVSSADAAREILKTHDNATSDRPQFKAFKKLVCNAKNITFSPYGEYWRKLRGIFVHQLLSSKRVQSFRSIREEETALFVNKIKESKSGPVNLTEMFAEFPNDLVCRAAFGTKYRKSEKGKKLLAMVVELMEMLGSNCVGDFIPWLGWIDRVTGFERKMERFAREMDDFLEDVIQEHVENRKEAALQEKDGDDFVDIMLQVVNENRGTEVPIEMEGVKSIIMDVLVAGADTASTALEWTMTELLRHPNVMEKLQNEVRQNVKETEQITEDDLDEMLYLKAVIKEVLRHHPPAPLMVPREVREDVNIKGYDIARGTMVVINALAIGMDPTSWDEPEKFWPERFLNSSIDFKGSNFELIPFGAGRRGCPGMTFAVVEIELLLANLVQKFDWKLGDGIEGKDLDMNETGGLAIHRAVPLLAIATQAT